MIAHGQHGRKIGHVKSKEEKTDGGVLGEVFFQMRNEEHGEMAGILERVAGL